MLGIGVVEAPIEPSRIAKAQGLFLTNSLRLIRPVTALDGAPLGSLQRSLLEGLLARLCADIARDVRRRSAGDRRSVTFFLSGAGEGTSFPGEQRGTSP